MNRLSSRTVISAATILLTLVVISSVVSAISASWGQYSFGSLLPPGKYSAYTKFPMSATPTDPWYSWVWDQTSSNGRVLRYDGASNSWAALTTGQDEGYPTPREGACWAQTMENLLNQRRLLLFGGKRTDDGSLSQEWNVFNLATLKWEMKRTSGNPPSPRWYMGCDSILQTSFCNPNCQKAVFYGGWDANKNGVDSNHAYALRWDTVTWTSWQLTSGTPPVARGDFAMVTADPNNNRVYVWGGKSGSTYYTNPAWIAIGGDGYHASADNGDAPTARAGMSVAVAFHAETSRSGWVMYGGYSGGGETTSDNFYNMQVNADVNVFTWAQFVKGGTWPPATRNAIFVCAGLGSDQTYNRCKQTPGYQTRYTLVPLYSQNTSFWRVTATF